MRPWTISGGVAKKRTAVHTTKKGLLDALLPHQCTKDHDHVHLEGSDPIAGRRTSFAENYPEKMCKIIADGLLSKEVKTVIYYTVGDDDESFQDESIYTLEDDEKEQAIYRPFLWVPSGLEPGGIPFWQVAGGIPPCQLSHSVT